MYNAHVIRFPARDPAAERVTSEASSREHHASRPGGLAFRANANSFFQTDRVIDNLESIAIAESIVATVKRVFAARSVGSSWDPSHVVCPDAISFA